MYRLPLVAIKYPKLLEASEIYEMGIIMIKNPYFMVAVFILSFSKSSIYNIQVTEDLWNRELDESVAWK